MPRVKARLREVQEVLGESDYVIAQFYYLKQSNRAARSRFQEIADHYPDFSQADSALWYLGQTLERLKTPKQAAVYYSQLITDFPLSPKADAAKERLAALHEPIPHPTRAMIARAQADETHRAHLDLIGKAGGMLSSSPNVSATRHGPVRLGANPNAVEVAKTPAPGTGGNTIAVEPVSDSSLNSAKAVEPKPQGQDPSAKSAPTPQESDKSSQAQNSSSKSGSTPRPMCRRQPRKRADSIS